MYVPKEAKYIGPTDILNAIHGKTYRVVGSEFDGKFLAIIDESEEPCGYLYGRDLFDLPDEEEKN